MMTLQTSSARQVTQNHLQQYAATYIIDLEDDRGVVRNELLDNTAYMAGRVATELGQPHQLCLTSSLQCMLPVCFIANGVVSVC